VHAATVITGTSMDGCLSVAFSVVNRSADTKSRNCVSAISPSHDDTVASVGSCKYLGRVDVYAFLGWHVELPRHLQA